MANGILEPTSIGYEQTTEPEPTQSDMDAQNKALVDHIFQLYERYKDSSYRRDKLKAAKINRKNYNQDVDEKQKDWPWKNASCLNLPLVLIAVDNIEPRMVAALEGKGDEICRFADIGEKDEEVQALQDWFNDELIFMIQLRRAIRGFCHDLCLDGTVFLHSDWDSQEEVVRDFRYVLQPVISIDPQTGQQVVQVDEQGQPVMMENGDIELDDNGRFVTEDRMEKTYDGACVDILDFSTVYAPDDAEDWERADVVREVDFLYGDLMQRQKDGEIGYMDISEKLFPETLLQSDDPGDSEPTKKPHQGIVHGRRVLKCLEAHISWDFQPVEDRDEGKYVGTQKIVALVTKQTKTLIRLCLQRELNFENKKMIRRLRIFPEYGRTYGTAIATKLKEIQVGASDTFNLVLNSAYVCMIPWFFYNPTTSGLDKKIDLVPGEGVPCQDPAGVKFPTFNINPAQFIQFINIFVSLWERISSVSDVQVGRAPEISGNRAQTATGTMMQVQESNVKHSYTGKMLQEEFADVLSLIYDLYYMNAPVEIVYGEGEDSKKITKLQMRKRRRFVLTGTTETANKYVDRAEAEGLYNLGKDEPFANRLKLFEDLLAQYGKHDPESYIDPDLNQFVGLYMQDPEGVKQALLEYFQKMQMQREIVKQQGIAGGEKPQGATQ